MTEESLPIEYSITGFVAVAATSRMISIDSDSSSAKVPSLIVQDSTPHRFCLALRRNAAPSRSHVLTKPGVNFPLRNLLRTERHALRSRYPRQKRQPRQSGSPSWDVPVRHPA